jgi:hypothetical protein
MASNGEQDRVQRWILNREKHHSMILPSHGDPNCVVRSLLNPTIALTMTVLGMMRQAVRPGSTISDEIGMQQHHLHRLILLSMGGTTLAIRMIIAHGKATPTRITMGAGTPRRSM